MKMIRPENIYKFRAYMRSIYFYNPNILDCINFDFYKMQYSIKNVEVSSDDFYINIEMDENASTIQINGLIQNIRNDIKDVVNKFKDSVPITIEDKEEFKQFISDPNIICNVSIVGMSITFSL